MAKFNFTPFSGDPLTHRINYYYMPGNISVSSPANYSTDADAIQAAETLREDADRMSANYMFLTGLQADTITRYKSEISGVFERLEHLERIATGQTPASPLYQDIERLERLYFTIQGKYCDMCANFEKWLYNQGYFGTIAARKDTPKQAILINA